MQDIINHVEKSLYFGEKEVSKLTDEIMQIEGLTSKKVKCFLNNLCGFDGASYLEMGSYKGATFCAAIYGNEINSIAIDDWKDLELLPAAFSIWQVPASAKPKTNPYDIFVKNLSKCNFAGKTQIINGNYLEIQPKDLNKKSNIIFYDGAHTFQDQYKVMSKIKDFAEDIFVLVVDDWNWEKRGILHGIVDFKYKELYKKEIFTKGEDPRNFWNGLGIFILSNI